MPARKPAISAVRRHENRQAEASQVMQRLVYPDQRPEPWMMILLRHAKPRCAKSLGAVDRNVNGEIDQSDKPEFWRDNQDQGHCNRKMYQAVSQQRQCPAGLLVLADRHPGGLQYEIRDDVFEREEQHPSDQRTYRNRRRHGGKQQS